MGEKSSKIGTFLNFLYRQIFAKIGTCGKIAPFSYFFLGQNRDNWQVCICQALWSRGSVISRRGWTIFQFTSSGCVKLNYIWTVFQFIGYKYANVSQRSTSVTILVCFFPQFNFCCLNSLQIYHLMLVREVFNKLFVVKYSLFVKMHE